MTEHRVDLRPAIRCSNWLSCAAVLALASLFAIGCGSQRPVVEGSVTLDGLPIAAGSIMLIPADGKGPTAGTGVMDGRFRVETTEGPKKVFITFAQKDGTKVLDPEAMGSGRMIDRYVESVPDRYNTKTELEITIKPGLNKHDFMLGGSTLRSAGDK